MKNTLVISYNGGVYGTYLDWILSTLSTNIPIIEPFNPSGNSHKFIGNGVFDMDKFYYYVKSGDENAIIRIHPKTRFQHDLKTNLEFILDNCEKMILLYPDPDHELLCVNNYMSKIWAGDVFKNDALGYINPCDIYDNFPVDKNTPLHEIPRWIQREFLSFNLFPYYRSCIDWYLPNTWAHNRCLIVTVKELLHDVESTVKRIQQFWGIEFTKSVDEIMPYHHSMINLQQYINHDSLCKDIIDNVINDIVMAWDPLTLTSEAWIQHKLRELGYHIKCDGLDTFPTDSASLRAVIEKK